MGNKVVAMDGPSASGKSTVARRVAWELGYLYVDSGALYRAVTWKALKEGIDTCESEGFVRLMDGLDAVFFVEDGAVRFKIGGIETGSELRSDSVNEKVSAAAVIPEVRVKVVGWLRDMVRFGNLVMEGRDIGTAVFPEAAFKFYLDASPEERARRRHAEMSGGNSTRKFSVLDVDSALQCRDSTDKTREANPLKVAPDAVVVDSTSMSVEEVARVILSRIRSEDDLTAG